MNLKKLLISYFFPGKWEIVVRKGNLFDPDFSKIRAADIVLKPPFNAYWADPFLLYENDKIIIFFEEFILKKNKGRIRAIELTNQGVILNNKVIIEKNYHLSFPFILKYYNEIYIIPETSTENNIKLFKSQNSLFEWIDYGLIIDNMNAVDSVLFYNNGIWYLLTSEIGGGGKDNRGTVTLLTNNSIFNSNNWIKSNSNPVVLNPQCGRNAGAILSFQNKNFRLAQNSSIDYGRSISIMEIESIDFNSYKENLFNEIQPYGLLNTNIHTINSNNGYLCFDRKLISFNSIISIQFYRIYTMLYSLFTRVLYYFKF